MALLLWLLTALVPCLLGMGALRVLYGSRTAQEMSLADSVLTGGMICIGLAEAAHLTAVVLGWSFSRCVKIFCVGVAVLCVAAAIVLVLTKKGGAKSGKIIGKISFNQVPWLLFAAVAVAQLICVMTMQNVYIVGDMTLETVNSFLDSDAVYEINPLTGGAYSAGMPFRLKILCLPTLYGSVCKAFGMDPQQFIYGMVPAFVLLGSYLAYSTLAKYFFPEDSAKRGLFMLFVAVLFAAGDYMPGMDGFNVLHSGFRGVAIRGAVLLPYTFGLMLRRKYKSVCLCILAEACIVWTLYGAGACLLVAAAMAVLNMGMKWYAGRKGGEEDAACRNS